MVIRDRNVNSSWRNEKNMGKSKENSSLLRSVKKSLGKTLLCTRKQRVHKVHSFTSDDEPITPTGKYHDRYNSVKQYNNYYTTDDDEAVPPFTPGMDHYNPLRNRALSESFQPLHKARRFPTAYPNSEPRMRMSSQSEIDRRQPCSQPEPRVRPYSVSDMNDYKNRDYHAFKLVYEETDISSDELDYPSAYQASHSDSWDSLDYYESLKRREKKLSRSKLSLNNIDAIVENSDNIDVINEITTDNDEESNTSNINYQQSIISGQSTLLYTTSDDDSDATLKNIDSITFNSNEFDECGETSPESVGGSKFFTWNQYNNSDNNTFNNNNNYSNNNNKNIINNNNNNNYSNNNNNNNQQNNEIEKGKKKEILEEIFVEVRKTDDKVIPDNFSWPADDSIISSTTHIDIKKKFESNVLFLNHMNKYSQVNPEKVVSGQSYVRISRDENFGKESEIRRNKVSCLFYNTTPHKTPQLSNPIACTLLNISRDKPDKTVTDDKDENQLRLKKNECKDFGLIDNQGFQTATVDGDNHQHFEETLCSMDNPSIDYDQSTIDYDKSTIDYDQRIIDYDKSTIDYDQRTIDSSNLYKTFNFNMNDFQQNIFCGMNVVSDLHVMTGNYYERPVQSPMYIIPELQEKLKCVHQVLNHASYNISDKKAIGAMKKEGIPHPYRTYCVYDVSKSDKSYSTSIHVHSGKVEDRPKSPELVGKHTRTTMNVDYFY